jgi:hypothetical protein
MEELYGQKRRKRSLERRSCIDPKERKSFRNEGIVWAEKKEKVFGMED